MVSAQSLALHLLITLRTISASPLPRHHKPVKRSTTSQNVGSGFAIAICVVFLAAISYYFGMHHERTKSWFSKRNAPTVSEPVTHNKTIMEGQRRLRQISCPLAVASSAPIKPYDDPVEAPTPSLRYYELPIKEVHEMGLPSPNKPPPRASWLSLDRKTWWLKYPEDEEQRRSASTSRSKSVRSWFKSEINMNNVQEEIPKPSPGLIKAVHLEAHNASEDEKERTSDGSTFMDWSGLDYVRRIYIGRKSRVGL
ncbi:hypothetical protein BU25DRAFT_185276 [Macroventuria anomochaeta]|uniref:Uncharacterized protein n=1 Tax=Macroventuria anomochaeta TaxID=301207 RepID=A0ACB6SD13_9PLEO|nr:uncharacterized protein BU25DRAFT_185276 [Macroventuria anomochaeta]KAF2631392.1 hypothetical protein BU25DRAFT_185276 [Macroventuria anomochaeta]